MAFAVRVAGKILVDTVYEAEVLSKTHWLSFFSGDYYLGEFSHGPDQLDAAHEFAKYPEAEIVRVVVYPIEPVPSDEGDR